jgi:hypothetical protein
MPGTVGVGRAVEACVIDAEVAVRRWLVTGGAVVVVVLVVGAVVTGLFDDDGDGPIDVSGFAEPAWASAAALTPGGEHDAVTVWRGERSPADDSVTATVLLAVGDPCGAADDAEACLAARADAATYLADAREVWSHQCVMCGTPVMFVEVVDDGVGRFVTPFDVVEFVGGVDTAEEAQLVAGSTRLVRADGDGWRFVDTEIVETCDPIVERTTEYRLDPDGTRHELRSHEQVDRGVCI